nr:hypothetical protein [Tanacetum cinerariifolium]
MPLVPDLSFTGLDEFVNKPLVENCTAKSSEEEPKVVRKNDDAPIIKEWVSDNEKEDVSQPKIEKKIVRPSIAKIEYVKSKRQEKTARKTVKQVEQHRQNTHNPRGNQKNWNNKMSQKLGSNFEIFNKGNPQMDLQNQRVIDSGCSRHMIGNMSYLTDYKEIDGGCVAFRGNPKKEKITKNLPLKQADESFFVGYSLNSKAFRVFNCGTRIVEENLCIRFSKSTPNVAGSGTDWLFHIDALIRTMNYEPVIAGTQSNGFAGTKTSDNAGQARKETEPIKDYILLPLWIADPPFIQDPKSSNDDGSKPSSDDEKKFDNDPRIKN